MCSYVPAPHREDKIMMRSKTFSFKRVASSARFLRSFTLAPCAVATTLTPENAAVFTASASAAVAISSQIITSGLSVRTPSRKAYSLFAPLITSAVCPTSSVGTPSTQLAISSLSSMIRIFEISVCAEIPRAISLKRCFT